MSNIRYAIQGLRNGEWTTLFSPLPDSASARTMLAKLSKDNPACRYRLRWFALGEPIIEQRSQPSP
jgi:hypothetical protein